MLKLQNLVFLFFLAMNLSFPLLVNAEDSCGKQLNAVLKFDPANNKAIFENFYSTEDTFCDNGLNELNANLEISLFDKNKKLLNKKLIYMNTLTILESLKSKKSTEFGKNKITKAPQFRNLKFSILNGFENLASYRIFSKTDNKIIGSGVIVVKPTSGVK